MNCPHCGKPIFSEKYESVGTITEPQLAQAFLYSKTVVSAESLATIFSIIKKKLKTYSSSELVKIANGLKNRTITDEQVKYLADHIGFHSTPDRMWNATYIVKAFMTTFHMFAQETSNSMPLPREFR